MANPYREWIGAQIRGDAFGYVNPGNARRAATTAYQDASLSHRGNGIYGEMWAAALVAEAFVSPDAATALRRSLAHVPPRSRLHEALSGVLSDHDKGLDVGRGATVHHRETRPLQLGAHHQQCLLGRRWPPVG